MATIDEDYVSFEVARLLKEKGFNENIHTVYEPIFNKSFNYPLKPNSYANVIAAPTLQMAMKWLRKEKKIGIFPSTYTVRVGDVVSHPYGTAIVSLDTYELLTQDAMYRDTYEEAVEAALKYCLEKLI